MTAPCLSRQRKMWHDELTGLRTDVGQMEATIERDEKLRARRAAD